jgi:hypothetical protein
VALRFVVGVLDACSQCTAFSVELLIQLLVGMPPRGNMSVGWDGVDSMFGSRT